MPNERYDRFLNYLEDPSRLSPEELGQIKGALGGLELESHQQTALKVMKSGVFDRDRFKRKTDEMKVPLIRDFEQFIIKLATVIDNLLNEFKNDQSTEVASAEEEQISPEDLAKRVDAFVQEFSPLEEELRRTKAIRATKLEKARRILESLNEDVNKWLSRERTKPEPKKKHWDKAKVPHKLVKALTGIMREHSPGTPQTKMAWVIVTLAAEFGIELKDNTVRAEIRKYLTEDSH